MSVQTFEIKWVTYSVRIAFGNTHTVNQLHQLIDNGFEYGGVQKNL